MRTLLHQFAEEFGELVQPLLSSSERLAGLLSAEHDEILGSALRGGTTRLGSQLRDFAREIAEQEVFVLVLGPLKNGKSTLMNALCGCYVSEVSSLPAYPCMVYVRDGKERRFVLRRYDGTSETYQDPAMMHMHIKCAHADLAERIRAVEARGERFDPAEHDPEAIHRIDIETPAGALAGSGAVLIDTPGLYSRMRFDYDRMTRDFRKTAACAVFVVKSENLFLEQVFDDFETLLASFGRVFLVINLDSTKHDLGPDGSLIPSAEQRDPELVIQAFENLAMPASLRQAQSQGRLGIYAIDLLKVAGQRLRSGAEAGSSKDAQESSAGIEAMRAFSSDLTSFLNGSQYVAEFVQRKLREGVDLAGHLRRLAGSKDVQGLYDRVSSLRRASQKNDRRLQAIDAANGFSWRALFAELGRDLDGALRARAGDLRLKYAPHFDRALDNWFEDDRSLQSLIERDCKPLLAGLRNELSLFLADWLGERVSTGAAGVRIPAELAGNLAAAEIDLRAIGRACLKRLHREDLVADLGNPMSVEQVAVRKRFRDRIAFRSKASVACNVLGPSHSPSLRVDPKVKAARLGKRGKMSMRNAIRGYLDGWVEETAERVQTGLVADYSRATTASIGGALREKSEKWTAREEEIERDLRAYGDLANALTKLRTDAEALESDLEVLTGRAHPRSMPASPRSSRTRQPVAR